MLERLKEQVLEANLELPKLGLVAFTWGNVSARDPESGAVVIKPSGLPYETMQARDMVIVDGAGRVLEGTLKPSSDLSTHLELYRHFQGIGGIVHTHSAWATVWAQACRGIPALGTTHADYFFGEVPCTRPLSAQRVKGEYEAETGLAIIERFCEEGIDPGQMPAVLVANHGPFTWGASAHDAVHHAAVLELTARMALQTLQLNPEAAMPQCLLEKHFRRKHGPGAYYGQS
jgi:L-ribulose-5-phosphate 4-epimerase